MEYISLQLPPGCDSLEQFLDQTKTRNGSYRSLLQYSNPKQAIFSLRTLHDKQLAAHADQMIALARSEQEKGNLLSETFYFKQQYRQLKGEILRQPYFHLPDRNEVERLLLRQTIEILINAELEAFLQTQEYQRKYDPEANLKPNKRNGVSNKTLATSFGEIEVAIARDRIGDFKSFLGKARSLSLEQEYYLLQLACTSQVEQETSLHLFKQLLEDVHAEAEIRHIHQLWVKYKIEAELVQHQFNLKHQAISIHKIDTRYLQIQDPVYIYVDERNPRFVVDDQFKYQLTPPLKVASDEELGVWGAFQLRYLHRFGFAGRMVNLLKQPEFKFPYQHLNDGDHRIIEATRFVAYVAVGHSLEYGCEILDAKLHLKPDFGSLLDLFNVLTSMRIHTPLFLFRRDLISPELVNSGLIEAQLENMEINHLLSHYYQPQVNELLDCSGQIWQLSVVPKLA